MWWNIESIDPIWFRTIYNYNCNRIQRWNQIFKGILLYKDNDTILRIFKHERKRNKNRLYS